MTVGSRTKHRTLVIYAVVDDEEIVEGGEAMLIDKMHFALLPGKTFLSATVHEACILDNYQSCG